MIYEVIGTTESGRPALDVFKWRALHYSYINDPAFGKDTAFTIGTCEGDGVACSRQLAAKLEVAVDDGLGPLQEIPLIRKKLNSMYKSCELKKIHAELTADDAEDYAVSRKLKIIASENIGLPEDLQLAMAYAFSQEEGRAELAEDLKNKKEIEITS